MNKIFCFCVHIRCLWLSSGLEKHSEREQSIFFSPSVGNLFISISSLNRTFKPKQLVTGRNLEADMYTIITVQNHKMCLLKCVNNSNEVVWKVVFLEIYNLIKQFRSCRKERSWERFWRRSWRRWVHQKW